MLAPKQSSVEIREEKAKPAQPGLGGKDVFKPNPLWQSLALKPCAIQRKLTVNEPGDPAEQQADRVADQVMRLATPRSRRQLLSRELTPVVQQRGVATRLQRQSAENGPGKNAKAATSKGQYQWEPGSSQKVAGEPLKSVPTYGTTVPIAKRTLVDVNVETLTEMLVAARLPWVGTMNIVGSGREYFKNHKVTAEIRSDFLTMLEKAVEARKADKGELSGEYHPGFRIFGSIWSDPFSKATWMVGKNDNSKIDYEASFSRVPGYERWQLTWRAKWTINDNLDLRPAPGGQTDNENSDRKARPGGQTDFYNETTTFLGAIWHDGLGGRDPAPVLLEWEESGKFLTTPPKLPLKPTGTPIKSLRPGDVRRW
jgi:hypothetical protein